MVLKSEIPVPVAGRTGNTVVETFLMMFCFEGPFSTVPINPDLYFIVKVYCA